MRIIPHAGIATGLTSTGVEAAGRSVATLETEGGEKSW